MAEDTKPPHDAAKQELTADQVRVEDSFRKLFADTSSYYIEQVGDNFRRVNDLILASFTLPDQQAQDVLRAAVVLNHAYLEDLLRTLAGMVLPEASEAVLNEIPLAGSGSTGRAAKFQLGNLAQHKGKTVDRVIRESITQHLDRATYNDTNQISQQLETMGFNVADHNQEFPAIQQMIQRRHQIVHRADRLKAAGSDTYTLQPVNSRQVAEWMWATRHFMVGLMEPFFSKLAAPFDELWKQIDAKLNEL